MYRYLDWLCSMVLTQQNVICLFILDLPRDLDLNMSLPVMELRIHKSGPPKHSRGVRQQMLPHRLHFFQLTTESSLFAPAVQTKNVGIVHCDNMRRLLVVG